MLIKTHLSITLFFVLIFLSKVEHKFWFVTIALIATCIPDVDSRYSFLGKKKINRILQFFTKHRGIIHSFTFLTLVTLILLRFVPVLALGFFLGYSSHLLVDSFTKQGIVPFYPWKAKSHGFVRTGGKLELGILISFVIVDFVLIISKIAGLF